MVFPRECGCTQSTTPVAHEGCTAYGEYHVEALRSMDTGIEKQKKKRDTDGGHPWMRTTPGIMIPGYGSIPGDGHGLGHGHAPRSMIDKAHVHIPCSGTRGTR